MEPDFSEDQDFNDIQFYQEKMVCDEKKGEAEKSEGKSKGSEYKTP